MTRLLVFVLGVAACQAPALPFPEPDWVADGADVLSSNEEAALVGMLMDLNEGTLVEMACVTTDDTGDLLTSAYAEQLLWRWEVGMPGVYNGVVVVINTREREVHLAAGDGMRWILTGEAEAAVLDSMTTYLANALYRQGLQAGIEGIGRLVADVAWDVTHFSLARIPTIGAEGSIVSFDAVVQRVSGDTVVVMDDDSVHASVLLLPGTTPAVLDDRWVIHGRVQQRDPLELQLMGLEAESLESAPGLF